MLIDWLSISVNVYTVMRLLMARMIVSMPLSIVPARWFGVYKSVILFAAACYCSHMGFGIARTLEYKYQVVPFERL